MSRLTKSFNLKDRDYLEKNLDTIKKKLAKQGYTLGQQLGGGRLSSYGFAFETSDGKVLKITTDEDEWLTSSKLLNKSLKHVVKIYRVFMLKTLPGIAFILQEKLFPLNPEKQRFIDDLNLKGYNIFDISDTIAKHYQLDNIEDLETYFVDRASPIEGQNRWNRIKSRIKNLVQQWPSLELSVRGFFAFILFTYALRSPREIEMLDNNISFIIKFLNTLNELVENKIYFTDTHSQNLMQTKEGVLKWIDLGGSSYAPGTSQIEHIEGMVINNKETLIKNLHTIKNKLEKQGYHLGNQLGTGTYGLAFEIQKGRVVKITTDESELESSAKILKKRLKHVAEIYRVFTLTSLQGIGFIEQEKLNAISKQEAKFVEYLDLHGSDTIEAIDELSNFYDLTEISELEQEGFDPEVCPRIAKYWPKLNKRVREFILQYLLFEYDLEKLDAHLKFLVALVESMGELYDNRVAYTDTSGSNLMKDAQGVLKWIDLGNDSQVIGPGEVEQIEGVAPLFRNREYIQQNIEIIKNKLAKQGYALKNVLSQEPSKYGLAFETQDGKVLKITTDDEELETSSKLIDKDFKHIVKIYRVFILNSVPGIGFISEEKLIPLEPRLQDIVSRLSFYGTSTIEGIRQARFKLTDLKSLKTFVTKEFNLDEETADFYWLKFEGNAPHILDGWPRLSSDVKEYIATLFFHSSLVELVDKNLSLVIELIDSLSELCDNHIKFTDTHGHNIMKNSKGTLKWIDIGANSSAPGPSHVEEIQGGFYGNYTSN